MSLLIFMVFGVWIEVSGIRPESEIFYQSSREQFVQGGDGQGYAEKQEFKSHLQNTGDGVKQRMISSNTESNQKNGHKYEEEQTMDLNSRNSVGILTTQGVSREDDKTVAAYKKEKPVKIGPGGTMIAEAPPKQDVTKAQAGSFLSADSQDQSGAHVMSSSSSTSISHQVISDGNGNGPTVHTEKQESKSHLQNTDGHIEEKMSSREGSITWKDKHKDEESRTTEFNLQNDVGTKYVEHVRNVDGVTVENARDTEKVKRAPTGEIIPESEKVPPRKDGSPSSPSSFMEKIGDFMASGGNLRGSATKTSRKTKADTENACFLEKGSCRNTNNDRIKTRNNRKNRSNGNNRINRFKNERESLAVEQQSRAAQQQSLAIEQESRAVVEQESIAVNIEDKTDDDVPLYYILGGDMADEDRMNMFDEDQKAVSLQHTIEQRDVDPSRIQRVNTKNAQGYYASNFMLGNDARDGDAIIHISNAADVPSDQDDKIAGLGAKAEDHANRVYATSQTLKQSHKVKQKTDGIKREIKGFKLARNRFTNLSSSSRWYLNYKRGDFTTVGDYVEGFLYFLIIYCCFNSCQYKTVFKNMKVRCCGWSLDVYWILLICTICVWVLFTYLCYLPAYQYPLQEVRYITGGSSMMLSTALDNAQEAGQFMVKGVDAVDNMNDNVSSISGKLDELMSFMDAPLSFMITQMFDSIVSTVIAPFFNFVVQRINPLEFIKQVAANSSGGGC